MEFGGLLVTAENKVTESQMIWEEHEFGMRNSLPDSAHKNYMVEEAPEIYR
jgi:hypothetical protein